MTNRIDVDGDIHLLNSDIAFYSTRSATLEPSETIEAAITLYNEASTVIDRFAEVKEAAKKLIADVMEKTGQTKYNTAAGVAIVSAPSQTVSYDAKAIDILLRDDPDLALRLSPYRKVSERAGTLRITATK